MRERIAFVELWRFGDAVLATAGLELLRRARPEAEIALVSNPVFSDPLMRSKHYDVHIPLAAFWTRGLVARDKYLPWTIDYGEMTRAWRALRAFRPDTVLLFRGDPREQLFFRSVAHGEIVDARRRHPILPGTRLLSPVPKTHRYLEYVHQVQEWANTTDTAVPGIANVLSSGEQTPYVMIHPGAGWIFRQWQPPKMAALADVLNELLPSRGLRLIVVGGPGDQAYLETMQRHTTHLLDVRYPSFEQLYSIFADATAVICNNSSALHIAEAVNTPCVAITGPSDPLRWGVYRPHSQTVCRSVGLPCHPCLERRCVRPDHPCIDEIGVADVIDALQQMGIVELSPRLAPSTSTISRAFPVIDPAPSPVNAPAAAASGLTFPRWVARVVNRWTVIVRAVVVVVALAILAMIIRHPSYRAEASFLTLSTSHLNLPSEYAGLASQFGIGQASDPGSTPTFYAALISSRELLTEVATSRYADPRPGEKDSATLVTLVGPRDRNAARALETTVRQLDQMIRVTPDLRSNLVNIVVETRWPTLSRDVANRVVTLVDQFNVDKRQSRAHARRIFIESRIADAQVELRKDEDALGDFYKQNRLWQQSPDGVIDEQRLRRQVQVANEVYLTLRREYETARIEEVNDQAVLTVVDSAVTPIRRTWPHPVPVLAVAIIVGLIIGVVWAGTLALMRDWALREREESDELADAIRRVRHQILPRFLQP